MRMNKPSGLAVAVALVGSCVGVPVHAADHGILGQLGCEPRFGHRPFYDRTAILKRQSGVVLVEFSVNAKGHPERPAVIEATAPKGLQSAALRVAMNFRCKPGKDWAEAGGPDRRVKLNVVFKFENEEAPALIDEDAEVVTVTAAMERHPR
jgi:TonB family protein